LTSAYSISCKSIRWGRQDVAYQELGNTTAARTFLFLAPERGLREAGPFLNAIAQSGRVIAPIYPSFANDESAPLRSISDYAYLMLDFVEALDLGEAVLVGSSVGGWIATEMLVRNPASASRLVLMGATGLKFGSASEREIADIFTLTPAAIEKLVFHDSIKWAVDFTALDDADVLDVARARQAVARFAWLPYMHNPELRRWLHRVRVPTLVLWGNNDEMTDVTYGKRLAEALPDACFNTISNCGHFPHIEKAAEAAAIVINFSARVPNEASATV
jgi:pimeloyl-ACP methyl ester carboxylesterase